ncbi:hypothetical protein J4399_07455 [Candidatus Woesearchaeota archaeon]|nr:hypothetical protein [Candidatus Woesearchaeota archaeon]HIH55044.1 hypothetical protein [Candidatus Woesearchaeota archaeon]HIJ02466.1 hypothetical protein [Candidatus Woesearchaeota archaeon]HIJ14654.1 hypothetical protein [Candidatus Woesearchaeota archaeon]
MEEHREKNSNFWIYLTSSIIGVIALFAVSTRYIKLDPQIYYKSKADKLMVSGIPKEYFAASLIDSKYEGEFVIILDTSEAGPDLGKEITVKPHGNPIYKTNMKTPIRNLLKEINDGDLERIIVMGELQTDENLYGKETIKLSAEYVIIEGQAYSWRR